MYYLSWSLLNLLAVHFIFFLGKKNKKKRMNAMSVPACRTKWRVIFSAVLQSSNHKPVKPLTVTTRTWVPVAVMTHCCSGGADLWIIRGHYSPSLPSQTGEAVQQLCLYVLAIRGFFLCQIDRVFPPVLRWGWHAFHQYTSFHRQVLPIICRPNNVFKRADFLLVGFGIHLQLAFSPWNNFCNCLFLPPNQFFNPFFRVFSFSS